MLYAISGLAGSGKTTKLIQEINNSSHMNHIIVVPSIILCKEIEQKITELSINVTVINTETTANTTQKINTHLEEYSSNSSIKRVIITTHATFRLMSFENISGWKVWHDELPPLFENHKVFYDNNVCFTDYFSIDPETGAITLTQLALSTNNHDALNDNFTGLIHGLKTNRFKGFAIDNKSTFTKKKYMNVLLIILPAFFPDDSTILSACIEDSLVYKRLVQFGAIQEPEILSPKTNNHTSSNIKIYYAIDNFNTKNLREEYADQFNEKIELIMSKISDPCIAVANNDVKLDKKFTRISHSVHGLNEYRGYKNVAFLSALNIDPETAKILLQELGVDFMDMYLDRTVQTAYQVIMRGALRLDTEIDYFNIFVMDIKLATELKRYFPNASVERLEGSTNIVVKSKGRPKKENKVSAKDRQKVFNMKKLAKIGYYSDSQNEFILNNKSNEIIKMRIFNKLTHGGISI